jgi:Uma2 family endonuclease
MLDNDETFNYFEEHLETMPSLNHSYICLQITKQLLLNETIEPLPELTLDIGNDLTPNISVFPKNQIQPNFFHDISKFSQSPLLAIEVISASQTIQEMLAKALLLIQGGVKAVWSVESHSQSVFVTTATHEALFHREVVESQGITVDFANVF